MVPLSMIRQKAFREFVEALDPRYVLPGTQSISKIHIPNFDKKVMDEVRMDLKNPEVKYVAMTSDGWSSKVSVYFFYLYILNHKIRHSAILSCFQTTDSYLSYTAHYCKPETGVLQKKVLECAKFSKRHTSENLKSDFERVGAEYEFFPKIVHACVDNAKNVQGI